MSLLRCSMTTVASREPRESGELVGEGQFLLEDAVRTAGEQARSEVSLELLDLVPKGDAVQKRRRVHEAGEPLHTPSLEDGELELALIREAGPAQHLLARIAVHRLLPPGRDAVA